jgi:predicted NBD/HSP70 family sugar kinase
MTIGNQQILREINISAILHMIREKGPISRIELARETKLSPTTVSVLIEEMIRENLVHEIGTSGNGVGRRMTLLNIRADGGYVIGIDLSSSPVQCVLLNLNGELIATHSFKPMIGEEKIRTQLAACINSFIEQQNIPRNRIKRIGVSIPGRLDDTQTIIKASMYLQLRSFPMARMLEDALKMPVLLVNDLDAAGYAERYSGAAKGDDTIIFLMIDYGTGAGIVLNGQVYHGSGGAAGRTPTCAPYCTPILADRLRQASPELFGELTPEETIDKFIELALSGVQPFVDQMNDMIDDLAKFCSIMLQMINPQKLILGGWIAENTLFFHRLAAAINKAENNPDGSTPVLAFHWKKYGAAMGAATLGLNEIFKQKIVQ